MGCNRLKVLYSRIRRKRKLITLVSNVSYFLFCWWIQDKTCQYLRWNVKVKSRSNLLNFIYCFVRSWSRAWVWAEFELDHSTRRSTLGVGCCSFMPHNNSGFFRLLYLLSDQYSFDRWSRLARLTLLFHQWFVRAEKSSCFILPVFILICWYRTWISLLKWQPLYTGWEERVDACSLKGWC